MDMYCCLRNIQGKYCNCKKRTKVSESTGAPDSIAVLSPNSNFNYVNITSKGCEGWLNLFLGDFCIAMVSDNTVANMIRAEVKEK